MVNLRWFRKHQKIMLVVFGVGLMVVFVLTAAVPYLGNSVPTASEEEIARANQTIVQWSGGKLNRRQMQRMLELHYATSHFQEALVRDSLERLPPQGPLVRPIPQIPASSVESADRAIFSRFMMAEYAKQKLGLVISDTAVYDYLAALTNSDVTQQYLVGIARQASPQVGYNQLHEYLKMELAAMRLEDIITESFFIGNTGAAPANVLDAWQAFLQTEKQIECAVEEFNAVEFLPQISGEPPAAELRAMYEEGKSRDADPTGMKPGFKRPRKVRVEYVAADQAAFLERAIQDVTPEQVQAEYNRLVEAKDPMVMENIPAADSQPEKMEGEKLEDDPAPEQGDKKDESGDPAPAPDANKDGDPAAETPSTEKTSEDENAAPPTDAPKDDKGGGEPEPAPDKESGQDKSSGGAANSGGELQYVSLKATPQEEAPKSDSPQEKAPDQPEPKSADRAPSDPEAAPSGAPQQEPSGAPEMKPDVPLTPPQEPAKTEPDPAKPTQQPKKLDAALELSIKQRLKRADATQQMKMAVDKARETMGDYSLSLSDYESMKDSPDAASAVAPQPLDLNKFAAENHLKYGLTDLCTYEELIKDPVGMATSFEGGSIRRAGDDLFINFDKGRLFDVQEIDGIGETYVYWLTEKVESRVPSFDEARNDVVNFWKQKRSVEMAKAAAEKVRDELKASGKSLAEERKDNVQLTGGFRWFQPAFNQVNYGAPKGVKSPGEEFMSVAFSLQPNDLGVALNEDRSAAYVIQLITPDPRTDEQLRDQFLDHIATVRQVVPSATNAFYNRKSVSKLIDELNDELKVEWVAY